MREFLSSEVINVHQVDTLVLTCRHGEFNLKEHQSSRDVDIILNIYNSTKLLY